MVEDIRRHALAQAAQRVSLAELALWLDAPEASIRAWTMGILALPERKFALVVDLLHKLDNRPGRPSPLNRGGNVYPLRRYEASPGGGDPGRLNRSRVVQ